MLDVSVVSCSPGIHLLVTGQMSSEAMCMQVGRHEHEVLQSRCSAEVADGNPEMEPQPDIDVQCCSCWSPRDFPGSRLCQKMWPGTGRLQCGESVEECQFELTGPQRDFAAAAGAHGISLRRHWRLEMQRWTNGACGTKVVQQSITLLMILSST